MSRRRPSPGRLGGILLVLGLLAAVAVLLVPVDAAFAGDPLLRLEPFGAGATGAREVSCGTPLGSLGRRSDGLSLYGLARDRACRDASTRRVAIAVAGAGIVGVLGCLRRTRAGVSG